MEPFDVAEIVRRITMGGLMLVHIQFAAFIIGVFGLAVFFEAFGMLSPKTRQFDRIAHGLGFVAVLIYSSGAVLAIAFILIISIFWPQFWYLVMQINFWPMVLEAITFVLTILFLFPWYYTWNKLAPFKGVHLALGLALFIIANLQQSMVDVMAGYMLTPANPQDIWRVFLNATGTPLDVHRIIGDISFAGFFVAGYAAIRALRDREPEKRAYHDWMGSIALIAGLGFLFLQPAVGLSYMEEIRANSGGAFSVMMRGPLSSWFLFQVVLLSGLFLLGMIYAILQIDKSGKGNSRLSRGMFVIAVLSALLLVQPAVVGPFGEGAQFYFRNPIGTMQPWKYLAFAGLTLSSLVVAMVYLGSHAKGLNWGSLENGGRRAQYLLLVLAVFGSVMMLLMGYIRENGRSPYLIYPQLPIQQQEQFPSIPPTPGPGQSFETNGMKIVLEWPSATGRVQT